MDYKELIVAVSKAFWEQDRTTFDILINGFLETAQGVDYGRALVLQASWFQGYEPHQAAQGFVLIADALPMVNRNPEAYMEALIVALGLCYMCSDVERARTYEEEASRLLLEQSALPEVRAVRHRLQMILGQIAWVRADYTTAYWYFMQAANSLDSPVISPAERSGYYSFAQVHVAMACLRVRRYWEAQEALDLADQHATSVVQQLRVRLWRVELLRQLGQIEEAAALLNDLKEAAECPNPEIRVRYHWETALVLQDTGNQVGSNRELDIARQEAAEQRFDFLLGEIQRCQRSLFS